VSPPSIRRLAGVSRTASRGTVAGMDRRPPGAVRAAFVLWLVAVGAGAFETALVVASGEAGGGAVAGVALRGAVFAVATFLALRMRAGRPWARWGLSGLLGVLGTLSLVAAPALWLLRGNSLSAAVADAAPLDLVFAGSRVVHVAAVLTACVLMFRPAANAWFRPPGGALPPAGVPAQPNSAA
jgi:hypothetical protein